MVKSSTSLKSTVLGGVAWNLLFHVSSEAVGFCVGIVLARLVEPGEFGLVAMVGVLMGFAHVLREFGLRPALVQKSNVTRTDVSMVFWFGLVVAFALCCGFSLSSGLIAAFYEQPRLALMTKVMSLQFILAVPISCYQALVMSKMQFRKLGAIGLASRCVGAVFGIAGALRGYGAWALVLSSMSTEFVNLILLASTTGWFLQFTFSFRRIKSLLWFGAYTTANRAFGYWCRNGDKLLVGKMMGDSSLGMYRRASAMVAMSTELVMRSMRPVLFRAFALTQADCARTRSAYLKACRWAAFLILPLAIGLGAVSQPFVLGIYGERWSGTVLPLSLLSFVGAVRVVSGFSYMLYDSQGRPDIGFRMTIIDGAITLVLFYFGLRCGGIFGMLLAYLMWSVVWLFVALIVSGRIIGLGLAVQLSNLASITLLVAGMFTAVAGTSRLSAVLNLHHLLQLALLASVGFATYVASAMLFRVAVFAELLGEVRGVLRRYSMRNSRHRID